MTGDPFSGLEDIDNDPLQCQNCGREWDEVQQVNDITQMTCPHCGHVSTWREVIL